MGVRSGPKDTSEYIASCAPEARASLVELRKIIREAVPEAEERISYGMPSYHLGGRLAYFSAHAKHVGLYPASAEDAAACGLEEYRVAKSTLRFPLDRPLPALGIRRFIERRASQLRSSGDAA